MEAYHLSAATLIARLFLGALFFIQGYDKVIRIKMPGLVQTFRTELGRSSVPDWILIPAAWYTSYAEFIGGFLLITGLFKSYVLFALGLDLVLVAIAMGMVQPMWNMEFVFPRLLLLLFLLIIPQGYDYISLDFLLKK
jgi:putative oxidoreductase